MIAPVALLGASAAACSLALDFSGIDDGVRDGAAGEGGLTTPDGGMPDATLPLESGSPDASEGGGEGGVVTDGSPLTDAPAEADAADACVANGPCPCLPGPAMVSIGSFCIDSTEVTVGQYTDFLSAAGGNLPPQPDSCSQWNSSLLPQGWPPSGATDLPIGNANWCQAYMYCEWAGKHLCGALDGGSADPNQWGTATESQWYKACSHNGDGLHTYPYGNTYDPARCNGTDYDAGGALPALASCAGGYDGGLFDMSGNLLEWEDSCDTNGDDAGPPLGHANFCHTRGGSYSDNSGGLRCDEGVLYTRESPAANVGFRCCWH
ncbi:MAG TPA: SUMF1/EgtB/PvdO family nonheme iron enzyme [Polyangiaceae bacterium]